MDSQQVAASLVQSLWENHQVQVQPGQDHVVVSNQIPGTEEGYEAWLQYRSGQPLMVVTPTYWQITRTRRSDQRYWHQLAVGYEIVIKWQAPHANDSGEVYSYYCPDPNKTWNRYQIGGERFGGSYPLRGTHDRFIVDHNVPGVLEARNGRAILVTACPARFAIVVEWQHYSQHDPNVLRDEGPLQSLGLTGRTRGVKGIGAATDLGAVQTTQGRAQYRPISQVLYIEAFPVKTMR